MKVDIISGFLGAGKTTLLNKILPQMTGKNVLIENEFGDIGVDGELFDEDLPVYEIRAGCICCSLVMDFKKSICQIANRYHPDRILIEPSGVGKLSDIVKACEIIREKAGIKLVIDRIITVVDGSLFPEYREAFGDFYLDQIENANILLISRMKELTEQEQMQILADISVLNPFAAIYEKEWYSQTGEEVYAFIEAVTLADIREMKTPKPPESKQFGSWSLKQPGEMSQALLRETLEELCQEQYGQVLRAKGMIKDAKGSQYHFDYTPGNIRIESSTRGVDTKVVVIGCGLRVERLKSLFRRNNR